MKNKEEVFCGVAALTGITGTIGLASIFNPIALPVTATAMLALGTAISFGIFLYSISTIARLDSESRRKNSGGDNNGNISQFEPEAP